MLGGDEELLEQGGGDDITPQQVRKKSKTAKTTPQQHQQQINAHFSDNEDGNEDGENSVFGMMADQEQHEPRTPSLAQELQRRFDEVATPGDNAASNPQLQKMFRRVMMSLQGNSLLVSGISNEETDRDNHKLYWRHFHLQETPAESQMVVSYLIDQGYAGYLLTIAEDPWTEYKVGVLSWDQTKIYSWDLFKRIYPHPWPKTGQSLTFRRMPRDMPVENKYEIIAHEYQWVRSQQGRFAHALLMPRLDHLVSQIPAGVGKTIPAQINMAGAYGMDNTQASSQVNRIEPPFPLAVDGLVDDVTIASIVRLQGIMRPYRAAHGTIPRISFFTPDAWDRVLYYIDPIQRTASTKWQDDEWFSYLLRRFRGEDIVRRLGGDENILKITTSFDDRLSTIGFSNLEDWQADCDSLVKKIQAAIKACKDKIFTTILTSKDDWARIVKKFAKTLKDAGKNTQLPPLWENISVRIQSLLLDPTETVYDLKRFVSVFIKAMDEHRVLMTRFQEIFGCDLSRLVPRGAVTHYVQPAVGTGKTPQSGSYQGDNSQRQQLQRGKQRAPALPATPNVVNGSHNQGQGHSDDHAPIAVVVCSGCGLKGHEKSTCRKRGYEDWNEANESWANSTKGKEFKSFGISVLPREKTTTLASLRLQKATKEAAKSASGSGNTGSRGASKGTRQITINALTDTEINSSDIGDTVVNDFNIHFDDLIYLIPGYLCSSRGESRGRQIRILALMDSGALGSVDLVGSHVMDLFKQPLYTLCDTRTCSDMNICSPLKGKPCTSCRAICKLNLTFLKNDFTNTEINLCDLDVCVVDMKYDFIVSLRTILKFDLLPAIRSFFRNQYNPVPVKDDSSSSLLTSTDASVLVSSFDLEKSMTELHQDHFILPKEHFFGDCEREIDGTEDVIGISDLLPSDDSTTITKANEQGTTSSEVECLPRMMGDEEFHHRIRALCTEFKDIFSRTVMREPADVSAFRLDVDIEKWHIKAHSRGARPQPPTRRAEIARQVNLMLKLGVIRRAHDVGHYSQVLLTPKPGDKWRFCIDYRILNALSRNNAGFPLPNIPSMLQRLGSKRFKYAGKLDFSSGYHQILMDPETAALAAFICEEGVFVPLRLMFGIMSAPSYYQGHMGTTVLVDLLYHICELYIDDIFTWGTTDDEFVFNLRRIFQRLRERRITVNPDKCELGVERLEFVGHVIDKNGISMSETKINKVLDFALPVTVKDLRSFVGLCNYFSEHIRNGSILLRPLHKSIARHSSGQNLNKKRAQRVTIEWLPEEEAAFHAIKKAVEECPKLFFPNDHDEIYLLTDASDYGIGGYLYQLIDGKEHPIRFMCHSLSDVECRWSTIEKECYAIFRAFQEMAYLIRDRKFHLLTDHRNLTFMANPSGNKSTSEKVVRWRLAIQEYDFDCGHIAGDKNEVADNISRLVTRDANYAKFLQSRQNSIIHGTTGKSNDIVISALCDDSKVSTPIPEGYYNVISRFHNELVGHFGVERTIAALEAAGHKWKGRRTHVTQFCRQCALCQKLNYTRPIVIAQPIYIGGEMRPMNRLCVDTVEIVLTADGYRYVLGIMDSFTRWIELFALTTLEAPEAANCLIQFFGRYGVPTELLSDNGSQFVNELIKAILRIVGTKQVLSLAYSKEENGRIERANKEILRHLRAFVGHSKVVDEWVIKLPFVQRIMNASVHSVTGFSPASMLFGNSIDLNRNIMPAITLRGGEESPQQVAHIEVDSEFYKEWLDQRNESQQQVLQASADLQNKQRELHLESVESALLTQFKSGDWVLILPHNNPLTGRRPVGDKLSTFWEGPYCVVSNEGNTYTLHDTTEDKLFQRHVTDLKLYRHDNNGPDPRIVAQIDKREFRIDHIVDHKGDPKYKKSLEFLVRWENHSQEYDLWLPWKELMRTEQLRTYLIRGGMQKLLPKDKRTLKK
jgi:hypothetical protein